MNVLIFVTHLLGTGHLSRALTLGRAFASAGDRVRIVSGGMPTPQLDTQGIELVQAPPLRSDGTNFTRLLNANDRPVTAPDLAGRRRAILATLESAPDIVITELLPFGRRVLRDEFIALLEAAHGLARRPLILSSIRDILAPPSKPARAAQTAEWVARYFDGVLVHADPEVTPLEASWPVPVEMRAALRYTGFVAPPAPVAHPENAGRGEILVSAGGGPVGAAVFEAAVEAARHDPRHWRFLTATPPPDLPQNVTAEPPRPDFRSLLPHCAASVSLCGYNTALDVLQAGCPAVFVPFDAGGETEQTLRAKTLARLDGIDVLRTADLSAERLLAALQSVQSAPPRPAAKSGFDGAARSVEIAHQMRREQGA